MSEIKQRRVVYDVPAREGRAFTVEKDELIKIIDVQGQQAVDFFAFCAEDTREYLSAEHTRVAVLRLFPKVGQAFYTNQRRPIVTFLEDGSPGVHDMLVAACDLTRYKQLGHEGWHASCQENLVSNMKALGIEATAVPQPVNLFTNFPLASDGSLKLAAAVTKPGDYVILRAELKAYICVSACPQDLNELNAWKPTEIRVEVGH